MFWIVWETAVSAVKESGSCWASSNILSDLTTSKEYQVQIKQIVSTRYNLTKVFEPQRYIWENLANLLLNILDEKS